MIDHLLQDTVTIAAESGFGSNGNPTFGAQSTINARVDSSSKVIRGFSGEEKQANHVFVTDTEVKQTHRVWLPGDNTADNNEARRPIMVKSALTMDRRQRYYEVYL